MEIRTNIQYNICYVYASGKLEDGEFSVAVAEAFPDGSATITNLIDGEVNYNDSCSASEALIRFAKFAEKMM